MKILVQLAAIALAFARVANARAHGRPATDLTWTREIGPLVAERCGDCHAGHAGLPSFATYADVRPWAAAMKEEVLARRMPPWPASEGAGAFANDRSLSPSEIDTLVDWVEGGAPEGDEPRAEVAGAGLAADIVVPLRVAGGTRVQTVAAFAPLETDTMIDAWTLRADDGALVASARVAVGRAPDVFVWSAAERWARLPADAAVRVPARARLTATLTFASAPRAKQAVALVLHRSPTARIEVRREAFSCRDLTVPTGRRLVAIAPSLPVGATLRIVARRPDGSREALLAIRGTTRLSPVAYRMRSAIPLPAKTRLEIAASSSTCGVRLETLDGER